ncbi:hypothetical protein Tco_0628379 [Tanacetum coccineum]|uniref:Uncharacterized protein n=1 Tax=Tanacetum coccineum TaxID=301880 RepID=A0ABQ4WQ70_9ASTR
MAGEDEFHDDNPPPPPPVTPTQQAPHTLSTIKLPILKKGEYDIWAMKMEHYLGHTDYPIWEVIQKGNGPVQVSTDTNGQIRVLPPKTAEEILARERERKARTTLLMSIPEDHLAKFHKMTDAKEMWEAIKSRFGGNDESKKMQKYILKQQFESFSVSNSEGLHKGYDRFQSLLSQLEIHGAGVSTKDANQKFLRSLPASWSQVSLIMRTKPRVDTLSFDDIYNNIRVFEYDVKGSTASSSSTQDVAFVSSESTSNTNDVDEFDLEEMDLKWQVAMIFMRLNKFYKSTGRKLQFDAKELVGFDKTKEEPKALVTIDGDGVDWTSHAEDEQENFVLMAYNNSGSNTEIDLDDKTNVLAYHKKLLAEAIKEKEELKTKLENFQSSSKGLSKLLNSQMSAKDKSGLGYGDQIHEGVLSYENEVLESVFDSRSSDVEDSPVYDRFAKVEGMHAVPPPMTGIYMPPKSDFGIDESNFTYGPKQSKTSESAANTSDSVSCESNSSVETLESVPKPAVNEPKAVSKPKVWSDAPIIEEYESDSDDEYVIKPSKEQEKPSFAFVNTVKHVKTPRETVKEQNTCSPSPKADKRDWNGLMSKKLGLGYGFTKKACFVCGSFSHLIRDCDFHEKRMAKQVELNKQKGKGTGQGENRPVWNNVQRLNHQNKFVPKAVLTKTGIFPVNTARQNLSSQAAATSTARKVNTARPIVNEIRPINPNEVLLETNASDSSLPNTVWAEAVSTTCYVLNRVFVTKPQNKRPYELITGKGPNWLFDLDYLTDSMNYQPVTAENKANKIAGPKEANHSTAKNGDEKPNGDFGLKINEEPKDQEDQAFLEELERLKRQEKEANDAAEPFRKEFAQSTKDLLLQAGAARATSTNTINTVSTLISTASPSRIFSTGGPNLINNDQDDSQIPALKDIYENPSDGIFTNVSYDDEGAVADFTNLETTVNVSPIPTSRIYSIHPITHILGDPTSIVQTRSKEELLQFKIPKVWILVDLPFRKKAIRTKWVYRNKKDERGVVVRNKEKYAAEILMKFDFDSVKTVSTPIETQKPLVKDEEATDVDVTPKTSHLHAVKRIFSDYAEANLDRKSTTEGCQFLGRRLISWQWKKQTIVATSTTDAKYIATANCCGQVLWVQNQLLDYGFNLMNTKIYIDNESTICIVNNLVFHSKTKHIEIRHHFIRDAYEKKLIQVLKIHTDNNVADLLTKAFDNQERWNLKSWHFYENYGVHTLTLEDGTEIHMLAERKYPLTKETLERMMSLKLIVESASDGAYDLLRFIQKQIDETGSHDRREKDL